MSNISDFVIRESTVLQSGSFIMNIQENKIVFIIETS